MLLVLFPQLGKSGSCNERKIREILATRKINTTTERLQKLSSFTLFSKISFNRIKFLFSQNRNGAFMSEEQQPPGSRPYFVQKIPLQSYHAQQVFKRGFDVYTRSVYSISVVLRAVTDEENVRKMEGIIDEKLNSANEDIRRGITQLEKIAEDNGITPGKVDYSSPSIIEAKISSHRSARYISIIREFDNLIASLDALWLSGITPDHDYSQKIYEWKRRILRIATHANSIVRQLAAESRKKNSIEKISSGEPEKTVPNTDNPVSINTTQTDTAADPIKKEPIDAGKSYFFRW